GGEDDDPGPRLAGRRRAGRERPAFGERFEAAEAAGGFDELVGGVADSERRGRVAGPDTVRESVPPVGLLGPGGGGAGKRGRRACCQCRRPLAPAFVKDEFVEWPAAFPAGGFEAGPGWALVWVAA